MVIKVDLEFGVREANRAVESGNLVVAIDVLRSSTSIINALANGVKSIIPVETLKEAYELHRQHPNFILAGERKGHKLKGFNLGNSPLEFTSEHVCGKTMIMTTTSGTLTLTRSRKAKWVFVGAFLNAAAVAGKAGGISERMSKNISLILAGEKGRFSLEDFVCAGAIADGLPEDKVYFSDKTLAALSSFKHMRDNLFKGIVKAEHAKHLIRLGLIKDVEFSCRLNLLRIVPVYKNGKVTIIL